ncbi:MAG: hypothetical protein AAF485_16245, partial [Chloroflexota bacterium]
HFLVLDRLDVRQVGPEPIEATVWTDAVVQWRDRRLHHAAAQELPRAANRLGDLGAVSQPIFK